MRGWGASLKCHASLLRTNNRPMGMHQKESNRKGKREQPIPSHRRESHEIPDKASPDVIKHRKLQVALSVELGRRYLPKIC